MIGAGYSGVVCQPEGWVQAQGTKWAGRYLIPGGLVFSTWPVTCSSGRLRPMAEWAPSGDGALIHDECCRGSLSFRS